MINFIVMSVAPAYFCSQLLSKPSVTCACIFLFSITKYQIIHLFLCNNKMLVVDLFYCFVSCSCVFLSSTIFQTLYHLRLNIFVLDNKLPDLKYCFCVTINYFQLINFFCFLVFRLYIFLLENYPNGHFDVP